MSIRRLALIPIWVWAVLVGVCALGLATHAGAAYWYYRLVGKDIVWKAWVDLVWVWDRPVAFVDWHLGFGYEVGYIPMGATPTWMDFCVYAVVSLALWYGVVLLPVLATDELRRRAGWRHAG